MLEDRFYLRTKNEAPICFIKIKRLYSSAIAREYQPLTFRVPNCNAKIAFNVVDEIEATLFVKMKNCFRISVRRVNVSTLLEPFPQLRVVINLAVENQPDSIIAAMHRLMPGC